MNQDFIRPITEEDMVNLFSERRFRKLLKESSMYAFDHGYESGFEVMRNKNILRYSGLIKGNTREVEGLYTKMDFGKEHEKDFDNYSVLDVHFHPNVENYVCPSDHRADLGYFTKLRCMSAKINCRPVCGVGMIDYDKSGELLLLQERTEEPLSDRQLRIASADIKELLRDSRR